MGALENCRIIGIDPGTRHVGYGIIDVDGPRMARVAGGSLNAPAQADVAERLGFLFNRLAAVLAEHRPQAAAVEMSFAGENIRAAITMGEARGMTLAAVASAGIPVTGYLPTLVKKAMAGSGRASKDQMREMMRVWLRLDALPATDHEADALALAVTHALRRRTAETRELPEAARRALAEARKRTLPESVLRHLGGVAPVPGRARTGRKIFARTRR